MDKSWIFKRGLPSSAFLLKAWEGEPLTKALKGINVAFALPSSDPDISLFVVKGNEIIGQWSANSAVTYWSHLETIYSTDQNFSTRVFIAIHKKAVKAEQEYLNRIGEPREKAFHNSGVAVLPEYRGQRLGMHMFERQIQLCRELNQTTFFCETTSRYSSAIVNALGFTRIAQYPYKQLAEELACGDLEALADSFSVWVLKI